MRTVEGWAEIDEVDAFLDALDEIATRHGVAIQAFDARYIAGHDHLTVAVERANRAVERDDTIADDRAVEILCYAAGRRQIDRAIDLGVREGRSAIAVVLDGRDEATAAKEVRDRIEADRVIGPARDEALIADYFHITERERQATDAGLEALVIERVSLLAVDK